MSQKASFDTRWIAAETILERVKHSCFKVHFLYRARYLQSRERLVYFDVPIIILSAANSVLIAGAENFLDGDIVNVTTCMLALVVGIIQALKTFFKVDENRDNCLSTYKDLHRLFITISTVLDQPRSTRGVDPQKYMSEVTSEYKEIMERAIVLEDKRIKLNPIYEDRHRYHPGYDVTPTSSDAPSGSPDAYTRREAEAALRGMNMSLNDLPLYDEVPLTRQDTSLNINTDETA